MVVLQTLRVDADWKRHWGNTDVCMGMFGRERVVNMRSPGAKPVAHWRSDSLQGVEGPLVPPDFSFMFTLQKSRHP